MSSLKEKLTQARLDRIIRKEQAARMQDSKHRIITLATTVFAEGPIRPQKELFDIILHQTEDGSRYKAALIHYKDPLRHEHFRVCIKCENERTEEDGLRTLLLEVHGYSTLILEAREMENQDFAILSGGIRTRTPWE